MNIVTGFRNEPHVTAEDMRVLIRSVYGNGSVITAIGEKLEPELISNNEVRIHDGAIVQQGCFGRIEANTYEVITIDNGSQDMKRIDLIVSRYEMNADTGIESMTLKLIKGDESEGTPIEPSYVSGNIEDGDLVDEFPLFRINLDGITVTSVDRLADPVQQVYSFDSIAESEFDTAKSNHAAGDYIALNGKLRKVTTAITAGESISDSNTVVTNVATAIGAIGKFYTMRWTATSSNAVGKQLTSASTIPKGTYLLIGNAPYISSGSAISVEFVCSGDVSFAGPQGILTNNYQPFVSMVVVNSETTEIKIQSLSSTSISWTNTNRAYARAIRLL